MSPTKTTPYTRSNDRQEIEAGKQFQPLFTADGLIPAIVTSHQTGEVLMFAWMNTDALALTIETRKAHFWSRSRERLWRKGEESGNELEVCELRTDCDQDVIWLAVKITGNGVACHTGARSCFYRSAPLGVAREAQAGLQMDFAQQPNKSPKPR